MYCTIFVPLSVVKVLGKHVRISSYLVLAFFKENLHSNGEIYRTAFSITITSHQGFRTISKHSGRFSGGQFSRGGGGGKFLGRGWQVTGGIFPGTDEIVISGRETVHLAMPPTDFEVYPEVFH